MSSSSMELSRPNFVEACDIGVEGCDDIATHLPWGERSCLDQVLERGTRRKEGRGTAKVREIKYLPIKFRASAHKLQITMAIE